MRINTRYINSIKGTSSKRKEKNIKVKQKPMYIRVDRGLERASVNDLP